MNYIWNQHRDRKNGGYFWSLDNNGPVDSNKQGYGHAFVLLAASSAKTIGHPLADGMPGPFLHRGEKGEVDEDPSPALPTRGRENGAAPSTSSLPLVGRVREGKVADT